MIKRKVTDTKKVGHNWKTILSCGHSFYTPRKLSAAEQSCADCHKIKKKTTRKFM